MGYTSDLAGGKVKRGEEVDDQIERYRYCR